MDFFLAASGTTMYSSMSITSHFATDPDSLRKIRDEFAAAVKDSEDFDKSDT